jgi:hypothetical protein
VPEKKHHLTTQEYGKVLLAECQTLSLSEDVSMINIAFINKKKFLKNVLCCETGPMIQ